MESRKHKKVILILVIIAVVIAIVLGIAIIWYVKNLGPVKKDTSEEKELIRVEIKEGTGISGIAKILEEKQVIKNANVMKIYAKINHIGTLQAGKYDLDNTQTMPTILEQIAEGKITSDEVKITFIEGKNMRWIAKTIAENTVHTEEEVFALLENEDYIDSLIEKYWFLTEEIKDEKIYYPLEGYLLPDTYMFQNENVSIETIFNVMLDHMDKYLSDYKDHIPNGLTVHQMLTMASIAELEGKSEEDRAQIIGVFFNRIYDKRSLGSDVTTYYAFKIDMGERDLTAKELDTENPYNTRGPNMGGKIPIGPICNPSRSAIEATINYQETDAYYFVADKNGKVYFTKTNDEHKKVVNQLKKEGLWFTYE